MPRIVNLGQTTELEAVNTLLSAIGEAPVSFVDGNTHGDVTMAVNILHRTAREVQGMGWRFNTDWGLMYKPYAQFSHFDVDNKETVLNVFIPEDVQWVKPSRAGAQMQLDLVLRPARVFREADGSTPTVFYDRLLNRDGLDAGSFPYLYVDVCYAFDFQKTPQCIRDLIVVRAVRRFVANVSQSSTLFSFTQQDEMSVYKTAKREEGLAKNLNMLDNPDVMGILGGRQPRIMGGIRNHNSPRHR